MKATEIKLLDFLRKSAQFIIQIYQRTYSWGTIRVRHAKLQSCAEHPVCHKEKKGSALERDINLAETL